VILTVNIASKASIEKAWAKKEVLGTPTPLYRLHIACCNKAKYALRKGNTPFHCIWQMTDTPYFMCGYHTKMPELEDEKKTEEQAGQGAKASNPSPQTNV
jgi:hypothetical protein